MDLQYALIDYQTYLRDGMEAMETFDRNEYTDEDREVMRAKVERAEELEGVAKELLEALDYLLTQTVDMDLKHGIGLTEGEEEARQKAIAAIAKAKGEE